MSETDNIKNTMKVMDHFFSFLDGRKDPFKAMQDKALEGDEERRERLDDARKEDMISDKEDREDWDMCEKDYL